MALDSDFIGVDDESFGDGGTDTQPIDTWLQNRLTLNMRDVFAHPRVFAITPAIHSAANYTTFAGIRPYAASEYHTLWVGRIPVYRGSTGYNITLFYHSDVPGGAGTQAGNNLIRITFGDGSRSVDGEEATVTYSTGIKTGHKTFTALFDDQADRDTSTTCVIEVLSLNDEADVATTIGTDNDGLDNGTSTAISYLSPFHIQETQQTPNRFWAPNSSGTAPDGDSLEAMYWKTNATGTIAPNRAGSQYVDLIYTEDLGTNGTSAGTVQGVPNNLSATSGAANMHQCFMLRGMLFEPIMTSERFTSIWPGRLAGNQPFEDDEALRLAYLTRQAYRRPRVVFAGPRGKKKSNTAGNAVTDMDTLDYYDYAAHWPFVMGDYDGTTNGQETAVLNEMVYLTTENPDIEVACTWVAVQHGVSYRYNLNNQGGTKRSGGDKFRKSDYVDTGSLTGSADWDMVLTLEQLDDVTAGTASWSTDTTAYGSLSDTVAIPVWAADLQNREAPPVLRGVDGFEQNSKGTGSAPGFWFREGSLFSGHGDFSVLFEDTYRFSVASTTSSILDKPFRLKMTMKLNSFTDPLNEDGTDAEKKAKLRLMLVSCTVIEVPREP